MNVHKSFSLFQFTSYSDAPFDPRDYSKLKFGSNIQAKKFGYALAKMFFEKHSDALIANRVVVIPSPYNKVENAATLMTKHFLDALNELLVEAKGEQAEYSIIHRKVSYTNDYGFLSKEKRKGLIDNDLFFVNKGFLRDKLLVFIDDVKITGTHEDKLKEVLADNRMKNDAFFVYFGEYFGGEPEIEAMLNFAAVKGVEDYIELSKEEDHATIIRPIKYLLSADDRDFGAILHGLTKKQIAELYFGCLAEGYYKIPKYSKQFTKLKERYIMNKVE